MERRAELLACLLVFACLPARGQDSVLLKLSTSTRQEIEGLSASDRDGLSRTLTGESKAGGNDLLCTRWGCVGGALKFGAADWRASPDGTLFATGDNLGLFAGLEAAAPVPSLEDYGVGAQMYAGYGAYDFFGRNELFTGANNAVQRQQLYSVGLFRRPDLSGPWYRRFGAGLVHDWSLNANASLFTAYYNLEQWRAKVSYELTQTHEVGLWGAMHSGAESQFNFTATSGLAVRPVDQLNFFYKYNLRRGGSVNAYLGPGVGSHLPTATLGGHPYNGLLWTMGGGFDLPLSDYVGVFAGMGYGIPRVEGPGSLSARETTIFSAQGGVRFFWGGNGKTRDDTGRRWMPYLPAPDNGNFAAQSNSSL